LAVRTFSSLVIAITDVNRICRPPPILVNQRDTLRVHAYNGLGDVGTALHSHGNFFNGTNYYDGAVGTTQCAIPPGESLTYEIPIDLQYGTYWIHVSTRNRSHIV
jgi:iron transport multicopper oxidase